MSKNEGKSYRHIENSRVQGYLAHKIPPLPGPYSRPKPRALWWSLAGGLFLMSEVPL